MATEFNEAAEIILASRGQMDCELLCPNRVQDEVAADIARHNGKYEVADAIMASTLEREQRCLGAASCNGQIECGIQHGNIKE